MNDDIKGMWEKVNLSVNSTQEEIRSLLNKGKELYQMEDYAKGLEVLTKCVDEDPDNLEAHYILGLIYTKKKDFNRAILHFNEITQSRYQYLYVYQVRSILSYIYSMQGDYESAKEQLTEVLKYNEKDIKSLSIMGYIYYKEKDYNTAKEYYTKILGIDGENANAYNSLGVIEIELEENVEKGISICKRALELQPDTPAYLDSIGWGYYKINDEIKAIGYLRKAFEKAPDNQEIKNHLKAILNI
ncbi:MAG: tetratricopeptide repeat protein [Spirochaetota bacterium]|nr:tetratricopeptide repeat protein [Spirochaetota bacterium]